MVNLELHNYVITHTHTHAHTQARATTPPAPTHTQDKIIEYTKGVIRSCKSKDKQYNCQIKGE